ncbi:MAG: sn-glycerol-3-phosphate ABC transporter ATP-binding protein UgpC [Smithellaceae bacterium]|nr:sn-glycerol-3-phosphate ABC transporter ATP-binding protein UgpC [Smithellaceae bacterium]
MAQVILKNLVKRFKSVTAVDSLSIEIHDREFAVLVGPSGCGKTTALRIVAGLETETSGEIFIGDTRVNEMAPKDRDIAMVFQNYALYPHMNVRENMGFGLKIRKYPQAEIDQRVEEAADILGIGELLERKPKELSGGQRQRVAVGRAIVRKPKVFLFDEPLSNLDAKLRVAMRTEISKLHKRLGATIIYVTHDQVEAMTMADRIFIMDKGALQQSGTPLTIYRQPANRFVAGFIGSPAMNFIEARLVHEGNGWFIDAGSFRLPLPGEFQPTLAAYLGQSVIFGIRPEDIGLFGPENGAANAACMEARVEVVETLGAEIFLYLTCGPHSLVARLEVPEVPLTLGQTIKVQFKMSNAHIFDQETSRTVV